MLVEITAWTRQLPTDDRERLEGIGLACVRQEGLMKMWCGVVDEDVVDEIEHLFELLVVDRRLKRKEV